MHIWKAKDTNYVIGVEERVEFYDKDTEEAISLSKQNEAIVQQLLYRLNTAESENAYLRSQLQIMEDVFEELGNRFIDAAEALEPSSNTVNEGYDLDYTLPDNVSSDK